MAMTQIESKPLLTVIVAVFNGAKTLQQCIDSFAQQTYENKELVIVDGGSRDGTVDLLKANSHLISYWISEPDRGIYNAWNKGLSQAKGEWICFLGADDYFWDAHVLEKVSKQLVTVSPAICVAYAQIMLVNVDGGDLYPVGEPWLKVKKSFTQLMCIPHQGVMHRRSLFERRGVFDESFRIAGDYELLLRELKTGEAQFIPDLITTGMRQGGVSSDPANTLVAMREIRRAQRMNGQKMPGGLWLMAMARVYIRFWLWRVLGETMTKKALDTYRRVRGLAPYWTKI